MEPPHADIRPVVTSFYILQTPAIALSSVSATMDVPREKWRVGGSGLTRKASTPAGVVAQSQCRGGRTAELDCFRDTPLFGKLPASLNKCDGMWLFL